MDEQLSDLAIKPFLTTILDLPPSCIEFSHADRNYFVVGTYNLQKEENTAEGKDDPGEKHESEPTPAAPQSRNGSLVLFRMNEDKL